MSTSHPDSPNRTHQQAGRIAFSALAPTDWLTGWLGRWWGGPHGHPAATDRRYLIRVENVSEPSAPFACSSRFAAKNGWNEVPAASSPW
jgi:hypothetical protein